MLPRLRTTTLDQISIISPQLLQLPLLASILTTCPPSAPYNPIALRWLKWAFKNVNRTTSPPCQNLLSFPLYKNIWSKLLMAYRVQWSPISPQATLLPASYVLATLVFLVPRTRQASSHLRSFALGILLPEILYSSLFTRFLSSFMSQLKHFRGASYDHPTWKKLTLQFFTITPYFLCKMYNV